MAGLQLQLLASGLKPTSGLTHQHVHMACGFVSWYCHEGPGPRTIYDCGFCVLGCPQVIYVKPFSRKRHELGRYSCTLGKTSWRFTDHASAGLAWPPGYFDGRPPLPTMVRARVEKVDQRCSSKGFLKVAGVGCLRDQNVWSPCMCS